VRTQQRTADAVGSEGIEAPVASRRFGTSFAGGWGGTLLAGVVLLVLAGALAWLGLTGRLADLRHANLPFHPYPPTGYALNPFNPGNPDDLINVAEANQVKADLLADGRTESDALARGDVSSLDQVATAGALVALRRLIGSNNSQGIHEKSDTSLQSVVVGKLADPNDPKIQWCVQESGSGTLTYIKSSTGEVLRSQRLQFKSRYWLRRGADGRYLIADSLVTLE
jgi:hypothetical protein